MNKAYVSILSVSVAFTTSATELWVVHANTVLIPTWTVYVYRDVLPLTTYTLSPADAAEGGIIWVKILILTYVSVIIPLVIPRQFIPADPKVEPTFDVSYVRLNSVSRTPNVIHLRSRQHPSCQCSCTAGWIKPFATHAIRSISRLTSCHH